MKKSMAIAFVNPSLAESNAYSNTTVWVPPSKPNGTIASNVKAILGDVDALIGGACTGNSWVEPTTTQPDASTFALPTHEASAQIKSLEQSLSFIPDGQHMDATRSTIVAQIDFLKKSISRSRPLGARLDSSRAALARAQKRIDDCDSACIKAAEAKRLAHVDHEKVTAELLELETTVAQSPPVTTGNHQDSITSMTSSLTKVLADMKASPVVPSTIIAEAECQMKLLVEGISAISALAQQAHTAAAQNTSMGSASSEAQPSGVQAPPLPMQTDQSGTPDRRVSPKTSASDTAASHFQDAPVPASPP